MPDSITTCKCGETYVVGNPENEAWHNQVHDKYLNGLNVKEVEYLTTIAAKGSLRLIVANNSIPSEIGQAIAQVAVVAQRCMPDFKFGYYGDSEPDDKSLYALADGTKIVGMVITSYDTKFWKMTWESDGRWRILEPDAAIQSRPKITRVWIAAEYRRRGLAQWLIKKVATDLDFVVSDIGWEMPFTDFGKKLAKSLCPALFFGCGDICPS